VVGNSTTANLAHREGKFEIQEYKLRAQKNTG